MLYNVCPLQQIQAESKHSSGKTSISRATDTTFTPCRFELEELLRPLQTHWLERKEPLLQTIITIDDLHYIILGTKHIVDYRYWSSDLAGWACNGKEPAKVMAEDPHTHVLIVTCRADSNVCTGEGETCPIEILTVKRKADNSTLTYDVSKIYECQHDIEHNERPAFLLRQEENQNENRNTATYVGACTSVRGQKDRSKILQWVEYHRLIGFDHFWIYLNENIAEYNGTLPERPYITYIPYDYPGVPFSHQQLVQNECIYRCRAYGISWVALHDVDEYFHVVKPQQKLSVYDDETQDGHSQRRSSIQDLINSIQDPVSVTGIVFLNWFYGRHPEAEHSPLLLDYTQRAPEPTRAGREKVIAHVQNVDYFSVHMVTRGRGSARRLDPFTEGYHNHYRRADEGVKGPFRGMLDTDTSLRDTYKEPLLQSMNEAGS